MAKVNEQFLVQNPKNMEILPIFSISDRELGVSRPSAFYELNRLLELSRYLIVGISSVSFLIPHFS